MSAKAQASARQFDGDGHGRRRIAVLHDAQEIAQVAWLWLLESHIGASLHEHLDALTGCALRDGHRHHAHPIGAPKLPEHHVQLHLASRIDLSTRDRGVGDLDGVPLEAQSEMDVHRPDAAVFEGIAEGRPP